jgi:hypothetical protein
VAWGEVFDEKTRVRNSCETIPLSKTTAGNCMDNPQHLNKSTSGKFIDRNQLLRKSEANNCTFRLGKIQHLRKSTAKE